MMQRFLPSGQLSLARPSFFFSAIVLIGIMLLYTITGTLLLLVIPGGKEAAGLDPLQYDASMVAAMRVAQVAGQILVLALPAVLLARLHAGGGFHSGKPLAFLGIAQHVAWRQVLFAVLGMMSLQPLLHSVTELQDLFLWPALGPSGEAVLESRRLMDALIGVLGGIHSFPEALAVTGVLAFTPACCEELFFRGYLQQNYYKALSPAGSVFFTGFVFAFFHLSAANLVPLTLLGWYIGYIFMKSGSLAVPFFVHLLNNLAALVFLHAAGSTPEVTGASVVFSLWWWPVVAGSLLLFVFFMHRFRAACS